MTTQKQNNFLALYESKIPAEKIEKKNGFDYLKWSYAWAEIKKRFPDSSFEKHWFSDPPHSVPYTVDKKGFAYVKVTVTIAGDSITEVYPVTNFANKSIAYPDSMQINTALQRALVKCIAYHGFGLLLYEGAADELIERPEIKETKVAAEKPGDEVKINLTKDDCKRKLLDQHADVVEQKENEFATINGASDAFDVVEKVFATFMPSIDDRVGAYPEEGFYGEVIYDTCADCVRAVEKFYGHNKAAIGSLAKNSPATHKRVMVHFKAAKKAAQNGEAYHAEQKGAD